MLFNCLYDVFDDLDNLAAGLLDEAAIKTVHLLSEKEIERYRLNENIDSTTAAGKLLFCVIARFAHFISTAC